MSTPLRLGVIGLGIQWTGSHAPLVLRHAEELQVTALCARSPDRLAAAAATFPAAYTTSDWQQVLARPDVDAMVVCTPIALNGVITLAALAAGKHVFVEKPFAMTVAQGRAILALEARSGRRVLILEQLLATDAWAQVRAIMHSGEIGTVAMFDRALHGYIGRGGDPWGFGDTAWRAQGEFPLGPLFDGGIHEIALQHQLFGRVQAVTATGQSFRPEHGAYDNINMLLEYEHGVSALVTHSGMLGGERGYFHIRGTAGLLACEYHQLRVEPRQGPARTVAFAPSAAAFWAELQANVWRESLASLAQGTPARYPLAMALHDLAVLEAVERSIRSGAKQRVEPTPDASA